MPLNKWHFSGIMANSVATKTSFQKGDKPTSVRSKGMVNKNTLIRREFEKNADKDAPAAYKELREAMMAKEGWAHQIFWQKLLPQKKATVLVDNSINRLEALLTGVEKFNELTYEEILEEIKVQSSVKLAAKIEAVKRELSLTERENLIAKIDLILAQQVTKK